MIRAKEWSRLNIKSTGSSKKLKALGIDDIVGSDFIDKQPSSWGTNGTAPTRSSLLQSSDFSQSEMLITVAMLSVESIFYDPREKREEERTSINHFTSVEGDHLTYLSVYRELNELLEKRKAENSECKVDKIMRKWCKDNFVNGRSLKHARDTYRALESGEIVHIHPTSVLFRSKPECVVIFDELMQTSKKYIKNLTRIDDPLWLAELAPHHYKTEE
ncbi:hypothetical protein DY000_02008571 [Brassica cretica]|uniref:RNA helicase n=1 Tax=Brassica cretica TaxID=69181 RepID=A0ABQ7CCG3_BRACR|nr:hypothetical protein DY000_02008571 [Brassica cretica]